jgi:succinate dehydrogenase / fumarate reductase cytochrome b subunit
MPFAAVLSILHRITGIIIFFGTPVLLWLLQQSLQSPAGFEQVQELLSGGFLRLAFFALLWAFAYHIMAGIKHLVMDLGHAETLEGARVAAIFLVLGNILVLIFLGVRL